MIVIKSIAVFLIGLTYGGIHGLWCLQVYIPVLSELSQAAHGNTKKGPRKTGKKEIAWLCGSLFGLGTAGALSSRAIGADYALAWYFTGVCLGFFPALFGVLLKMLWLLLPLVGLLALLSIL